LKTKRRRGKLARPWRVARIEAAKRTGRVHHAGYFCAAIFFGGRQGVKEMELSRIRTLRQQRAALAKQMADLIPAGGPMPSESREKFDRLDRDQKALASEIEVLERQADVDRELSSSRRIREGKVGDVDGAYEETRREIAFRNYLRGGRENLSAEDLELLGQRQYRDMGTGGGNALQGTGGGYFVPVGFINRVEDALKYYGDMLNVSTILDTATGQPLPHPTDNDTTVVGEIVGEGASVSTADVTLGNVIFNAYKFSTKMIKVSLELLQDSAFDIEGYLATKFGTRLGRILNTKFTVGGGTTEPTGIITAATASGQTVIGDDNATSPDPTTEVGYLDLLNLEHSVDILYRRGAKFMFHDTTLRFIKGLKDKYGRPLWLPGIAVNSPDTILGYPYSINNDMAQLAAGHITVAFGDLSKYTIRRVKELAVLRLVERFADYGQVAFLGFARYDGNLLDAGTHPVKYLVQGS
jgi:HK97 family phage major capsid protein